MSKEILTGKVKGEASMIPRCQVKFNPGEGYYYLVFSHMEEVLGEILL
jgi:hypothetical protein